MRLIWVRTAFFGFVFGLQQVFVSKSCSPQLLGACEKEKLRMKHGKITQEFGLWLSEYLKTNKEYSVFYDHGNPQENSNVAVIKGFFGDKVNNRNRLTDIDAIVVNNNKEIVLLIEIEESEMSPKKLVGDIFSMVMCNQFAVRIENENKYFSLSSKTCAIIAGIALDRGNELTIIKPRLQEFQVPIDGLQLDKIKIVTKPDILKTLEELKNQVRSIFAAS